MKSEKLRIPITSDENLPLTRVELEEISMAIWNIKDRIGFEAPNFFMDIDINLLCEQRTTFLVVSYPRQEFTRNILEFNLTIYDFAEDIARNLSSIAETSGVKFHYRIPHDPLLRVADKNNSQNNEYFM